MINKNKWQIKNPSLIIFSRSSRAFDKWSSFHMEISNFSVEYGNYETLEMVVMIANCIQIAIQLVAKSEVNECRMHGVTCQYWHGVLYGTFLRVITLSRYVSYLTMYILSSRGYTLLFGHAYCFMNSCFGLGKNHLIFLKYGIENLSSYLGAWTEYFLVV